MAVKNLWETEHPYSCQHGCFYHNGCHQEFSSWQAFLEEWGDADEDFNLLFRWDWYSENSNDNELNLFFMQQRKASPFSVVVKVSKIDEPIIRTYLTEKLAHLMKLWAGVA